jgi:hypothetical protein
MLGDMIKTTVVPYLMRRKSSLLMFSPLHIISDPAQGFKTGQYTCHKKWSGKISRFWLGKGI